MNPTADLLARCPPDAQALVELTREGSRREWTFAEATDRSCRLAGTLASRGVRRGDVVMTLIGNRPDWVFTLLACWRLGAVAFPANEMLRAHDLRLRLNITRPRLIVADQRNRSELEAASPECDVVLVPDAAVYDQDVVPAVAVSPTDPAVVIFTSGTSGEPKAVVHGARFLAGQHMQAQRWFGAKPDTLAWCTAASGWSKSTRNVFLAPWLCGASALLHDGRFDPHERLAILERERVDTLCMAPTEYRVMAKRTELRPLALRSAVAAGEALNPEVLRAWRDGVGADVRDGYGQTETGQTTSVPAGETPRPGSMGPPLPGVAASIDEGELVFDPATVPTFFLGYLDPETGRPVTPPPGRWRTGDLVRADDDGWLYFEGRTDDVIISAGYRIGPFEVESALVSHPAVAEAAAVAAPDDERGSVVRAVIVLSEGAVPSDALTADLQVHVKEQTAPYKYPRIVEFVDALPHTASGKVQRAVLRGDAD